MTPAVLDQVERALERAADDLQEWADCKESLEKAGFNMDDTADRARETREALSALRAARKEG